MIDPDISTQDALRLLTTPDDDPRGLDRRRFLQLMGWGVGAGALAGGLGEVFAPGLMPGRLRDSWAATPIGATDGILVLVGQFGGSDGLNTVVPYTNSLYYQQHGTLAVPANQVLPLNAAVGLHPSLPYLKTLYDRGEVAVVQGVGYENPDLSHFTSMALWMYGKAGNGMPSTGWIGRWLDGMGGSELFRAATVGQGLPLHLIGDVQRGTAIPQWGVGFGGGLDEHDLWMYDAMRDFSATPAGRGPWHDAIASTMKGVIDVGQQVGPVFSRALPEGDLEKKMTVVARLINADLGLRVIDTGFDGFDTHSSQPAALIDLHGDFDAALRAFYMTLDDRFRSRVTIMTYSEFGRTSWSNDSDGTDHGTVNNHFVIGQAVKGGLYGAQPSLAGLDRWDRMDHNVDFRSMYASVLDGWMGGGASTVLGGNYPNLGLFRTGPGAGVGNGSLPVSVLGDFMGVTPFRLYDSRTLGRKIQLGAGTTGEVQVLGQGGVPLTGVTAVALNVTATGATVPSTFTVWPAGDTKPSVVNVITPASRSVPNLVIVKVGTDGRVNVANDQGNAHCVVDVVGYFRTTAANRLQSVTPYRVLDTRNGTGGRTTPIAVNSSYDVTVRGVAGVPAAADSVVVNVTAVAPTAAGYLTVWPSGQTRPNASSVNFVSGQAVPNLVIAKVGTNGKISVYNANGSTHVVVDILGYMSSTAPGRHFPLAGGRLLDTRPASGGTGPMGAASTRAVQVLGVGGVPASGVSAVALNIAAYGPTANTFITAWPNGDARPNTSNLNPRVGTDVLNLAIVKVGTTGKVQLYNQNGSVNVVVDVVGYFTA
ncbi:MAG: DUF1501 domain-containing protein [Actinomycetota bacterium]|nr:DUF1501 domain-containing protein [Actinomycetota bacterium]